MTQIGSSQPRTARPQAPSQDGRAAIAPQPAPRQAASPAPAPGVPSAPAARDEIELLIRARYPVLYVLTWEEARVEEHLARIAAARGKTLYTWSVTAGLRKHGAGPSGQRQPSNPIEVLDTIIEHKEPAIYLLRDLHPYVKDMQFSTCNAPTIRKLREAARSLSDSYKTIVLTSPVLEISKELEKDVTVVDYPLPGPEDFARLLGRICDDVREHAGIDISLDDASREALVRAAMGLTAQEAENVFAKTLVNDGRLDAGDVSVVFAEKQQIIRKSGLLEYCDTPDRLGDVGGLDVLKDWLARRSRAFTDSARAFGLPAPKGVLLVGVQGCGKSLCAKAVSSEWNMPLLRFDVGRMFGSLVGSSEENIRRAIAVAESIAPVVLWVDEIDKAFAGSAQSGGADGGTAARVMSTFLTWLSEKSKPVFVLATANDITNLPPELLRKGRLDEIFFVDLPNPAERRAIFDIHVRRRRRDPASLDIGALVEASDGFSGAEIEQAIISALYDAFYTGGDLTTEGILASLRETVPLSRTMSERISALRGWANGRARFASTVPGQTAAAAPTRKLELD